jgi:hypothetical protein
MNNTQVSGSLEGKYRLSDYNTTVKAAWSTANVLSSTFEFQVPAFFLKIFSILLHLV